MKSRIVKANKLYFIFLILIAGFQHNTVLGEVLLINNRIELGSLDPNNTSAKDSVILLLPANGDTVYTGQLPYFAWDADSSISSSAQSFNLKIVEITAGQSLNYAVNNNKSFFEQDSIKENYFQYPPTAPEFKKESYYGWIVQALDKDGNPVGDNNGTSGPASYRKGGTMIIHDTINTELKLINPSNSDSIYTGQLPYFAWWATSAITFPVQTFKLRIVEVEDGQTTEEALKMNNSFFEQGGIKERYFQYTTNAPEFITGKTYAWVIQALDNSSNPVGGNNGTSEPFWFRKGGKKIGPIHDTINTDLTLINPANGDSIQSGQLPNFSWQLDSVISASVKLFNLKIYEILAGQSPIFAASNNKTFFEKDGITEKYFNYPAVGPSFKVGMSYAWTVQALDSSGNQINMNNETNNIYWFRIESTTDVSNKDNLPINFSLAQNYPNPFNPSTTIRFNIPVVDALSAVEAHVTLKVYDVLGREVATLVNEQKQPGNYEVKFDGSKLSSGIYFYKLTAGNINIIKKMILLK